MINKSVLISGIGIAGPALAYWLKAGGFEPTLVEQSPGLRKGGYVLDFWGLGYDLAERMGLGPGIEQAGYHMRELRVVDDGGRRAAGFGVKVFDELTNGRYVTLARSDLSRLLYEKIENNSEVIFDDEIVGLNADGDQMAVQFKHGAERRFDLVIGADGLHSTVRNLVFGPESRFEKPLGYAVAAFESRGYRPRDEDVYLVYGQPGRMVGRFTLHGDRVLFLFVFTTEGASLPDTLEGRKQLLRGRYGSDKWECPHLLEEMDRTDSLYFDFVSQIRMEHWSHGRVALVGDAAFCVSLLAGQGSALAMIAAYVLAGELAAAGGCYDIAFARYESVLRDFIKAKQRGAERFATAFAPRTPFGLWFRNLVINALSLPGLARFVIGRDIVDRLTLPDYRWPNPLP